MRYLSLPLIAAAFMICSAGSASADPPSWSHARSLRTVPELSAEAMPAALVLLAGGAALVLARRRRAKGE